MKAGLRILISGHGRMAAAVEAVAVLRGHVVTGFVSRSNPADSPTVHAALARTPADVVIDFTHADALDSVLAGGLASKVPVVTGTTGWSERRRYVRRLVESGRGTLLHAANFSLGVQLFLRTVEHAGRLFGRVGAHDVGVEERHHARKADAPSGTAIEIARALSSGLPAKSRRLDGSPGRRLEPDELHVSSLRVGWEYGRHVVVFDSEDDVIELSHSARGRRGFAAGAVQAAEWVMGRSGVFTLDDMIDDMLRD